MKKEIKISLKDLIETIGVSVLIFNNTLTLEFFNETAKKLIPDLKEKLAAEAIFNSKRISLHATMNAAIVLIKKWF